MDDRPAFAQLLRRHREAAGLTQEGLAERARLSARAVSDLERGARLRPQASTVRLLATALALPPGDAADLAAAARGHSGLAAGISEAGPAAHSEATRRRGNLPLSLTSFVGREREMAEVAGLLLLPSSRLLTLTGTGGCGKTRLALRVAAEQAGAFADGVWLVDLAPLSDPALVAQDALSALDLREFPGRSPSESLVEHLRSKHALLVLDNCEHLVHACAELADAILRACPRVRVLATSREPLGVAGEVTWRVPSLELPAPGSTPSPEHLLAYDAIRLFVERARLVRPGFALTDSNGDAVARVCRHLDGIPLAIELAAPWVRMLSIEQMDARLEDRFRLLSDGSRTVRPRYQTLRAMVEWSYNSLSGSERTALRSLSVFTGGWTLEAAEAVCQGPVIGSKEAGSEEEPAVGSTGVLELLARLIDTSLVQFETSPDGPDARPSSDGPPSSGRYRLLETIRQFAWELLRDSGEHDAVRDRHAGYYLALGRQVEAEERRIGPYLLRLRLDFDNLRTALRWLLVLGDRERTSRLLEILGPLWQFLGHLSEGRERLSAFVAAGGLRAELRAEMITRLCWMAWLQGDYAAARSLWEENLALRRELGDQLGVAFSLNWIGVVARDQGDYDAARPALEESLTMYRAMGDRAGISDSLARLASVAHAMGDLAAAGPLYDECLVMRSEVGNERMILWTHFNMALLALDRGDAAAARTHYAKSLPLLRLADDTHAILHMLALCAGLAAAASWADVALRLGGAIEAVSEATTFRLALPYRQNLDRWLTVARRLEEPGTAAEAWAAGRAMSLEQAVAFALHTELPA